MELDWFTVAAQIVNFLILVYLLKRFLYGSIVDAMERREAKIAGRLQQADAKALTAEKAIDEYRKRLGDFESQRDQLHQQAREEADNQRTVWLDGARAEVEQSRRAWQQEIDKEKKEFLQDLRKQFAHSLCSASRRMLAHLADEELEKRIIGSFMEKLRDLPGDEQRRLRESCQRDDAEVVVSSAFEINEADRNSIRGDISDLLGSKVTVRFTRQPDLICGIALATAEARLEWNVNDFCERLDENLLSFGADRSEQEAQKKHSTAN